MGALAIADAEAVTAYAECQARHRAMVQAYEEVRRALTEGQR